MKKNILSKAFLVIAISVLGSSCVSVGNLGPVGKQAVEFRANNDMTEFVETRTASGIALSLSEVLALEKEKFGNDISFVNVVVQRKGRKVFYIYDIVRNKGKISK